jgi:dipeptidyl aminopeptidase/acylaminoacyl peptidase
MQSEEVSFTSSGYRLAGTLKSPSDSGFPRPAVVQGPGWLGLRGAGLYAPYHQAFLARGLAVLCFDYRGFGGSAGDPTWIDPGEQVEDFLAAVDYVAGLEGLDSTRIAVFGSGATGGGNAIVAGALDRRIKAVASQVPIAEGRDWLRRQRTDAEWLEFVDRLDADRRRRHTTGLSELVLARGDIQLEPPERRTSGVKKDVDSKLPAKVRLASAEAILRYRPIDYASRLGDTPLLIVGVEGDAVTPFDHASALFQAAPGPKRLVVQTGTTHYAAYSLFGSIVSEIIADWIYDSLFDRLPNQIQDDVVRLTPSPA